MTPPSYTWHGAPHNNNQTVIYKSRHKFAVREAATVLAAQGIDSEIIFYIFDYLLIVSISDAPRARQELADYRLEQAIEKKESEYSNSSVASFPPLSKGVIGGLFYMLVLLFFATLIHNNFLNIDMVSTGGAKAGLIQGGEWWRAITALTLHVELYHLLGNLVAGVIFGLFASQVLGAGVAWLTILLSGILGNMISAFIHSPGNISIGASTAIFAALGIQSAITWRHWYLSHHQGIRRFIPIIGGVILLGLLGGPGHRVDVISHLTGFIAGIITGSLFGSIGMRSKCGSGCQLGAGLLAIAIIGVAWGMALR